MQLKPEIWAGLPGTRSQPWNSGAFTENGDLKPAFMKRVAKVIEAADEIGMIVCLGLFYFGQDERISDEKSVKTAVEKATNWILAKGYTNVLLEINNECDVPLYEHEILCPDRVHELINLAKSISKDGARLLVSTSFTRRMVPTEKVIESSDFILLHGNGMHDPVEITNRVQETRNANSYKGQPIFFNEDDHFEFENESNNFVPCPRTKGRMGIFRSWIWSGWNGCLRKLRRRIPESAHQLDNQHPSQRKFLLDPFEADRQVIHTKVKESQTMAPSQNISLEGKVAFISGASKGIGVAISEAFSNGGC
ncbi:MAG: hypothetical protein CM1200mP39_21290 [Dehalococcoidia bacterium]|nr:MAG: hypothetical protein CM1200mP39_21290 [Dehalococcoidia bacterium]